MQSSVESSWSWGVGWVARCTPRCNVASCWGNLLAMPQVCKELATLDLRSSCRCPAVLRSYSLPVPLVDVAHQPEVDKVPGSQGIPRHVAGICAPPACDLLLRVSIKVLHTCTRPCGNALSVRPLAPPLATMQQINFRHLFLIYNRNGSDCYRTHISFVSAGSDSRRGRGKRAKEIWSSFNCNYKWGLKSIYMFISLVVYVCFDHIKVQL